MQEQTNKVRGDATEEGESGKRRRLEDIESEAMKEEDPEKLAALFERYRLEYQEGRSKEDREDKRRRVEDEGMFEQDEKDLDLDLDLRERASGSGQAAAYEEMEVGEVEGDFVDDEFAWDDVNDIALPIELVRKARCEEMQHMKGKIFKVVKKSEAWSVTGKAPISTKWVDTDKTHGAGAPMVRARWVARDFKSPHEKDREDLFSASPPIELIRLMLSRQATRRSDGRERKTMYLYIKKAHLAPKCDQDVYVDLPSEADVQEDECGKLIHWLYGCRPAAQAWEEHYSELLVQHGFKRLKSVPVAFSHKEKDLIGVVHGDDFVFSGLDEDLDFALDVLAKTYELKNRGRLGTGPKDVRKIDMLGRLIEITDEGITWTGDPRHQDLLEKHFGMDESTKVLGKTVIRTIKSRGGSQSYLRKSLRYIGC